MKPEIHCVKDAFKASPGPETGREALLLSLKGACMGAADTVPGVSGGTIALITGIYEQLLAAIRSADQTVISRLVHLDVAGAVAHLHTRFLLFLFSGIAVAVISLARIVSHFLAFYPVSTWSLFFGLIAASIGSVGRKVDSWGGATVFMFSGGAGFAYILVGLVPAQTPDTLPFVFFSGMLAICAMILPGISGAFILVLLGKYEFMVAALKNPFLPVNTIIIAVFAVGCGAGLAVFSRVLKHLLERFRPAVMAFLTGLLAGSLRRIWPWKDGMPERNILPEAGPELLLPLVLMAAGAAVVLFLEWISAAGKNPAS